MNAYSIKVYTKLGSEYQNTIFAESEEAALVQSRIKYPLQTKIVITGQRAATNDEVYHAEAKKAGKNKHAFDPSRERELKLAKAARAMKRGALFLIVGGAATIMAWIAGYISSLTLIATGFGLIDLSIGFRQWKNNRPRLHEDWQLKEKPRWR